MLHRGEGKTLRTYEVLLEALDMQKYETEAEKVWKNEILKSSWSIPSRLVSYALDMFDRHHKPLEVIKVFKSLFNLLIEYKHSITDRYDEHLYILS